MAEVAAGLWAAEEVVSTSIQAGIGAYMVAIPTMPLKATFTQIATSSDDNARLSLARFSHTITVVSNKAYIFGGETAKDQLAGNEVHAVTLEPSDKPEADYSVIPAISHVEGGKVPAARTRHAACAFRDFVVVYGGVDSSGELVDNGNVIWLFNTTTSTWQSFETSHVDAGPGLRSNASIFAHQDHLLIYGGQDATRTETYDIWSFDTEHKSWTQLPSTPTSSPTSHAAFTDGVLYATCAADRMSGNLHFMQLAALKSEDTPSWSTIEFPTNPLIPGPLPRQGAGFVGVSTGYGRNYLLYFLGARESSPLASTETAGTAQPDDIEAKDGAPQYWSDIWTFQLPSSQPEMKATTKIYDAIKPARIKDNIREALGVNSGKHSWAEVEVLPPADLEGREGKVHPGPRGYFASDVLQDGRSVVVWGGINAKGECEGDGWIVRLQ